MVADWLDANREKAGLSALLQRGTGLLFVDHMQFGEAVSGFGEVVKIRYVRNAEQLALRLAA